MKKKKIWALPLAGGLAGAVNGLFGAGGGMMLVPLLTGMTELEEDAIFPASIGIILPICVVSLISSPSGLPWDKAFPYLAGGCIGGLAAGLWGRKIPVLWLHRILGGLIIWGGIRILW